MDMILDFAGGNEKIYMCEEDCYEWVVEQLTSEEQGELIEGEGEGHFTFWRRIEEENFDEILKECKTFTEVKTVNKEGILQEVREILKDRMTK